MTLRALLFVARDAKMLHHDNTQGLAACGAAFSGSLEKAWHVKLLRDPVLAFITGGVFSGRLTASCVYCLANCHDPFISKEEFCCWRNFISGW